MWQKCIICALSCFITFTETSAQDSLSLSNAVERALNHNYHIRISQLDQKIATIQNSWGEAGGWPSLDFSLSVGRSQSIEPKDDWTQDRISGDLSFQWILFDGFAVHIRKSQLNQLEKLSEGNTALLIEQTIQSVILAYYNSLLQQEKLAVLDTLRTLSKDQYDRAKLKKELGVLVTYDLLQAKNSWLEDQARYLEQVATARNGIRDLNYLMGETGDKTYILTEIFKTDIKIYETSVLYDKMKSDNKMLRNKYIQQALLEKEVALKWSDWLPSVSLRAGIEGTRLDQGISSSVSETRDGYATLNLRWNLFSGGQNRRAVAIARVNRDIGQIEIDDMIHTLSNQLAMELELYHVRKELLEVAGEALETSALNLQISKEKFETGAINSFNYRDVQLLYLNAAVSRLEAIYKLLETETELMRLTGGILSSYRRE